MDIDIDKMTAIARNSAAAAVSRIFGDAGRSAFYELSRVIRRVYEVRDPALLSNVTIAYPIAPGAGQPSGISIDHLAASSSSDLYLVAAAGLRVTELQSADPSILSVDHIIYTFNSGNEAIIVGSERVDLLNPLPQCASIFSMPRFRKLEDALQSYALSSILHSTCLVFNDAWLDPSTRAGFKNKPEATMRRSLERFLSIVLNDADVRPEGIIDETHPVDIRVVWRNSNSVALIEIKWLGASLNDTATDLTRYSAVRARSGAKQLADYLDDNLPRGTMQQTRGILVVIDGRRGKTKLSGGVISSGKSDAFRGKAIPYSPDYAATRTDFSIPYRMYAGAQ